MSPILKTETMEIDMNLAVVNMFPQQWRSSILKWFIMVQFGAHTLLVCFLSG